MDEAAETVTTFDVAGRNGGGRDQIVRVIRRSLPDALVRTSPVVVGGELDQHALQMALSGHLRRE